MNVFPDGPLYVNIHSTSASEYSVYIQYYEIVSNSLLRYAIVKSSAHIQLVRFSLTQKSEIQSEILFQRDCPNLFTDFMRASKTLSLEN